MPNREDSAAERRPNADASGRMAPQSIARLNVAMVIQRFRPEFSGQGIQMEQLCRALAARGVRPAIVSATRESASHWEDGDGYRIRRVRTDLLPGSRTRGWLRSPTFGARVMLALLGLGRVDVVHAHGLNDGFYGAYAYCRLRHVPLVFEMTLMGVDDPETVFAASPFLARARHRAYRNCDAYVAMSRAFLPSYAAAGMPADRLRVIPQGVDTRRFTPRPAGERAEIRAALGCASSAPVVAFAGSLIERKGIDILLSAWVAVHQQRPDAHLLLVGPGDFPSGSDEGMFLDARLAALASGARAAIHRTGRRDDPERFMAAADVFAFPSRREGFGSVIIEAMACGVPTVVCELPGITDYLFSMPIEARQIASQPRGDGIVVRQEDAGGLATVVLSLLGNPAWAADVGASGLATARQRFDMDRVIAPAYEDLYASLVRSRPRA